MHKLLSFLNVLYFSFFSKAFYQDVYHNLRGKQIGFLLRVAGAVAIIAAIVESYAMLGFMNNLAVDKVITQLPLMVINNDELQVIDKADDKPIFIRDSNGKVMVIVDDLAKDNKYQSEDAMVVVTNNGIFLNDSIKFKFSSLFQEHNLELTHEVIEQYWKKLLGRMKFTLPFFMFGVVFFGLFIKFMMYSAFFTVAVMLLHKIIVKQPVEFDSVFRLGIFASLPAIILSILLPEFLIDFIEFGYLIFAYYSVIPNRVSRL